MKKGYYIHFNVAASAGVMKKVSMQLNEFRNYFEMEEIDVVDFPRSIRQRIIDLFPTRSIKRNYDEVFALIESPDFIYIRRSVADKEYMKFLARIRGCFPECKIIVEIFTYPYLKDDFGEWNAWPFLVKELLYRGNYKRYIDRFVTYSDDEAILKVPTIRTINGIRVEKIRKIAGERKDNIINLVTAAYMQKHHGYERIITGLHQYYRNGGRREIVLHLVGDGPEKRRYYTLVKKYGLESHVIFYPTMVGDELDNIYDRADIALASFGMYKIGIDKLSALKTREYLAKGIPIATGCKIDILEDGKYPYVCQFSNCREAIDIKKMVSFYDNIYSNNKREDVIHSIREYAWRHVDNSVAMKPIIDYVIGER